jgi:hypothetical protein
MQLTLDHTQRLNLLVMLDALECQGRREAFAICRLQEKLELSDQEREAIGWRKIKAEDGREVMLWNNNGSCAAREYDLAEDDIARICHAVDKFPVVLGRDKNWWLPLTAQLPEPAAGNGDKLP